MRWPRSVYPVHFYLSFGVVSSHIRADNSLSHYLVSLSFGLALSEAFLGW